MPGDGHINEDQLMRLIPRARRNWLILALVLVGLVGGAVAWLQHDPWPARMIIKPPDDWLLPGFAADGGSIVFIKLGVGQVAWDLTTDRPRPPGTARVIRPQAFSHDGRSFLAIERAPDGVEMTCVDVASGAVRVWFLAADRVYYPSFAADDRSIRAVLYHQEGDLELATWDLTTGAGSRQRLDWSRGLGSPEAGSPDGELIAFAEPADWPPLGHGSKPVKRLLIRDVATGQPRGSIGGPAFPCTGGSTRSSRPTRGPWSSPGRTGGSRSATWRRAGRSG